MLVCAHAPPPALRARALSRPPPNRLRKELGLLDVYAIATGATLSAGFFLLPGLAAREAGPALVLSYLIAAIPLIPAVLSKVELATAMPRAGGVYYFLDRSLGPLVGTIGGIGIWLVLSLKVAFALIGMGAYLSLFVPRLPMTAVAIALALALGAVNLLGARKSGRFQILLVLALLTILTGFVAGGLLELESDYLDGFFDAGASSILSTAGLVFISYVGLTKVVSLSEEVRKPERNLPLGVFLSLGTVMALYGLGTLVMVGVVPQARLAGDLTPAATAANLAFGPLGRTVVSAAALLAFLSVANAGTLSASRYPLAMSRDHILPRFFDRLGWRQAPTRSIALTVAVIVLTLGLLDPTGIAKLASTFQLLVFSLLSVAVIVMRESRIESYDPGYRSPGYPWLHVVGIVAPIALIAEMGWGPLLFSAALIAGGAAWYRHYARDRIERSGAMYHVFERLGQRRYGELDRELRGILKEKGLREQDPFDQIVARACVLDLPERMEYEEVVGWVAKKLAGRVPAPAEEIRARFLEGTRAGATPVTHDTALPHFRLDGLPHPEMALVRSKPGVRIQSHEPMGEEEERVVHSLFFLVSPEGDPGQHLRLLAQIAGRVDEETFARDWHVAEDEQQLKEVLLRDERFLSLYVSEGLPTAPLVGRALREVSMPEGTLVALIRRGGRSLVPRGGTVLREGDRLTILGEPDGIGALHARYVEGRRGTP